MWEVYCCLEYGTNHVFLNQFSWIRGIKKNWGCNLPSVDPSLRRELSKVSPWNSWKEKKTHTFLSLIKHAKKSFERYEIRCSRCCTSPFNSRERKTKYQCQILQAHTSFTALANTNTRDRTPPFFSMYPTWSNIHSSGSVELFEKHRNL